MKKQITTLCLLFFAGISSYSQSFVESNQTYSITTEGNKYIVSGFVPYEGMTDEIIYVNTLLWAIENVSPQLREGINDVNIAGKSFNCNIVIASPAGSGQNDTYFCKAIFRVADGKLIYYLCDIFIESTNFVSKKITPMEKLTPDKKPAHRQQMDKFEQAESAILNQLFDYISTYRPSTISHWNEITARKPVKGMTEDECRLAFGKPQSILETSGEVQWMYSSSFYLFFRDGVVSTIIK